MQSGRRLEARRIRLPAPSAETNEMEVVSSRLPIIGSGIAWFRKSFQAANKPEMERKKIEATVATSLKKSSGIKNEEMGITGSRGVMQLYLFGYKVLTSYWALVGIPIPITAATIMYPSIYSFFISGGGIDFFFVTSAYLLSKKMTRGDYPNLKSYYVKRIFRIWPVFYLTILVSAFIGIYHPNWLTFVFAMDYFRSTFQNNQLWTVMVEEPFYPILPLWIMLFVKGRMKYTIPILLAITIVYRLAMPLNGIEYYDKQFPSYSFDYAVGTALGLSPALKKSVDLRKWKYVALGLFIVYTFLFPNGYAWFSHIVFAGFFFLMIANFSNSFLLTNRFSIFLGRISYPFSLFGSFIVMNLSAISYGNFGPLASGSLTETAAWYFVVLVITILVSTVAHYAIEKPFIGLGQKFTVKFHLDSKSSNPKLRVKT